MLHANALDPQRSLVIGNRGVGKSFWSSVLTHHETREAVAPSYPRLPLMRIQAVLGFHEDAGKDDGPAPSPAVLSALHKDGHDPEAIWRAVLLKGLGGTIGDALPTSLKDIIAWSNADVERCEHALRRADKYYLDRRETFLIVFDALDRLGRNWDIITPLTQGVLRLALDMRGFKAMKAKVFMRTDQSKDDTLFRFADASKLRSDAVALVWRREELFGLLYKYLSSNQSSKESLLRLMGEDESAEETLEGLLSNEALQEELFHRLAGDYMGAGPKRGRPYNWLYSHLADTFGETSPRSFITAIQRSAEYRPPPRSSVIDHVGIRTGVQNASSVRVQQLKEDYEWIEEVLNALDGLEVPCEPTTFIKRWRDRKTVQGITADAQAQSRLLPLEILDSRGNPEEALLQAMTNIGVVEFRTENRINVPDIFRVAAGIKRRGGVRPPSARRR
ncbi:hypothetical protein [Phreatobacter sp. AB_2022a]|uniref:hypothetical protein n=1 Tax=Phreatobacter sp. AB_2022a TaxID=3003134 RepID=UPI0022875CE2|nr:hypothetical protein [Phreatobacter sp. AB_2022a]MCZ0737714.1 hypothetical protein [Phreatobacter sp. AB_2022a]